MLMHFDGRFDGESGGNRRHEPWDHAAGGQGGRLMDLDAYRAAVAEW
jgi:hypothetical protein